MIDLMTELKAISEFYKSGDFSIGLEKLNRLWGGIPDRTGNAYLIIEYAVAFALKAEDFEAAQQWASRALPFAKERHDMGEVEFLVGKVAFERGELGVAKDNFLVANQKSRGRIFHGEDSKYKALLK